MGDHKSRRHDPTAETVVFSQSISSSIGPHQIGTGRQTQGYPEMSKDSLEQNFPTDATALCKLIDDN